MLEDHTQFVNVSIIFIDKTDPTDPLKREQYWRYLKHIGTIWP